MLPKSTPGGSLESFWDRLGAGEHQGIILNDFRAKLPPLLRGFWATCSALLFFSGLRDTKKEGLGARSKLDTLFGGFWGLAGGPQEGSLLHDSSISTFAAGPKKGSKMGAKMERFGFPNPSYTNFGPPIVRKWCQKSCIEKRLQNLGAAALWSRHPGQSLKVEPWILEVPGRTSGGGKHHKKHLTRLLTPRGRRILSHFGN